MIAFELTMPGRGSWDGHWSGENDKHYFFRDVLGSGDRKRMDELDGKNFEFRWDDGWTACVSCQKVNRREMKEMQKQNTGFCGYDWMVESIWRYNRILKPKEWSWADEHGLDLYQGQRRGEYEE